MRASENAEAAGSHTGRFDRFAEQTTLSDRFGLLPTQVFNYVR